jgi:hypothetical protein
LLLLQATQVALSEDGGQVTCMGRAFLGEIGVSLCSVPKSLVFCQPCLDRSERRPHLAGLVGAALLDFAFARGWVQRIPDSRALVVTPAGKQGFADRFGIDA